MSIRISIKSLAALALLAGLSPLPAYAQQGSSLGSTKALSVNEDLLSNVLTKVRKSLVRVMVSGEFSCMGTIVQGDGLILTKLSELHGSESISCELPDGRMPQAKILAKNDYFDLVLLKIDIDELTAVEWTLSNSAAVGSWVASAGPDKKPAAVGVVGVAARNIKNSRMEDTFIPRPNGGFLGIQMDVPDDGNSGVRIKVSKDSPAEKAGLKDDDIVVGLNGMKIFEVDQLRSIISGYKPSDKIKLQVKRSDKELAIEATLAKRPASLNQAGRGDMQNRMGSQLSDRRSGFPTILQHDGVIKPTDCGAPLVDLDGHVVGLNIARAGRTESYAIPSETILSLLPDLMAGKNTNRILANTVLTPSQEEDLNRQIKAAQGKVKDNQSDLDYLQAIKKRADDLRAQRKAEDADTKRVKHVEKLEEMPKPAGIKN